MIRVVIADDHAVVRTGLAQLVATLDGVELRIAEPIVAREGFNVNRSGVVFGPVVEGRDLAELAFRLASCAHDVHVALLDASDR